jgi:FMN phosphatase YigB (HAD superfamily)
MIRAILFDWGRTLYDSERGALFPEVAGVASRLARRHRLAIVSLLTAADYEARLAERYRVLRVADLERHFAPILFAPRDKDALYRRALAELGLRAEEVAVVDDRAVRGIRWGNHHGATTIWLRGGAFAGEAPDAETGAPTHTIGSLGELEEALGR